MKKTDWLVQRFDKLEEKMDKVQTETIPQLLVEVAKITTAAKTEAKIENKNYTRNWGIITLAITTLISLGSMAVAYFKH